MVGVDRGIAGVGDDVAQEVVVDVAGPRELLRVKGEGISGGAVQLVAFFDALPVVGVVEVAGRRADMGPGVVAGGRTNGHFTGQ